MKKLSLILLSALFAVVLHAEQQCDAIITTDNFQIQCVVTNIGDNEIQYKECQADNGEIKTILISNIRKLYLHDGTVTDYSKSRAQSGVISSQQIADNKPSQAHEEVTSNKPQESQVDISGQVDVQVSNESLKTESIASGETVRLSQTASDTITIAIDKTKNLARVETYGGVLVFTDCTPVAPYEILGDVTNATLSSNEGYSSSFLLLGGLLFSGGSSSGTTPQYPDIRNQLVINALMANRQVEGILISLPKYGEGRATLIKFKDGAEDKALARVNYHLGVLVFTDCTPINSYTFVGNIPKVKRAGIYYNNIRDKLIMQAQKKFPATEGIITHLISGGHDSAEAIKF